MSAAEYFPAELVFHPPQPRSDAFRTHSAGPDQTPVVDRGAGEPMVLYVKRARYSSAQMPAIAPVARSPPGWNCSVSQSAETELQHRHSAHMTRLQERLSLKQKSADNLPGGSSVGSTAKSKVGLDHALHEDICSQYTNIEEQLLSRTERSVGTVRYIHCMAECGHIFRDVSAIFVPLNRVHAVEDAFIGSKDTSRSLERILSTANANEATHETDITIESQKNLATLFFGSTHCQD